MDSLTKGIISGAIIQSWGGINRLKKNGAMPTLAAAERDGVAVLRSMGYHSIEDARQATQEELLEGVGTFLHSHSEKDPMMFFSPVIDGYVFPRDCNDLLQDGDFPDLPIMIGCTADEMERADAVLPDEEGARATADSLFGPGYQDAFLRAIHYEDSPETALRMFRKYVDMTGGTQASTVALCENQARLGRKPIYRYYFTLVPPSAESAHHSAEHQYVFQTLLKSKRPYTGRDWDLSNQLADYWANFIKTGNPNGEGLPEWTPFTLESPLAMKIDYNLQMSKESLI